MQPLPPDRWQRADRIFDEALDLPPADRAAFVAGACSDDVALRDAVLGLLAAADEAERIIGESAEDFAPSLVPSLRHAADVADALPAGTLIGPWRIISEIARGGMGAVYLAERADGEFEKRVALKLVKRGMDTDEILRRFHHERRILASLEHPNIARLYDAGAASDGRPYLVMELVDGLPITRWCDEQRCDIESRLDLFLTLCDAVQYAHGRLIVHRDIKPSNILVSADGAPRLLDFGIAKLLDDEAPADAQTRTGLRLATPEYAAPEQLRGEPISIATDVYALGVLLYELLAGQRPFTASRPHDGGQQPQRPSTATAAAAATARATSPERLRRRLAGELDTIVLKALEDETDRRYASVADFVADVRRHRDGLPIRARPATPLYRARKFVLRNRAPAAFAALAVLSLLGGTAAALLQARQAARERDAAFHERGRAEQVTAFLVGLFESADPTASDGASGDTLRVRAVLDRGAHRIRAELAGRPALQGELFTALARIYTSLGAYEPAESLALDALAMTGAGGDGEARATRLGVLARIALERAEFARADSLYAEAAAAAAVMASGDSLYAAFLAEHGLMRSYLGDYDSAVNLLGAAYERARRVSAAHGPLMSRIDNNLGMVRYDLGEYAAAEALFRRVYDAERAFHRENHPALAATLNNIASSVQYQGRNPEAEPIFFQAIETARDALGAEHTSVGDYLQNLATLYDDERRHDEAEPLYREALRIYEREFGRHSPRTALLLRNLALNREAVGQRVEAASLLREIEASLAREVGADHFYTVVSSTALARVLTALGQRREAFDRLTAGIAQLEAQLPAGHFLIEVARRDLGAWYAANRDFERAEPLLLASHTALVESRGADNGWALEGRDLLRRMYEAWGRPERAAEFAR
jgi:eukaryotic-like serine/threonine-protein kinase